MYMYLYISLSLYTYYIYIYICCLAAYAQSPYKDYSFLPFGIGTRTYHEFVVHHRAL